LENAPSRPTSPFAGEAGREITKKIAGRDAIVRLMWKIVAWSLAVAIPALIVAFKFGAHMLSHI
jgi:hypothetical protein